MHSSQVPIADAAGMKMKRRILHSWKEIASYVGRGVRTIQRYEGQFGLPVHRLAGRSRSSVMAFPDEIDGWLSRTPTGSRQFINVTTKPSEKESRTVVKGNAVGDGIDTCPLCCGTGRISSKHGESGPDRTRFHKQKISGSLSGCAPANFQNEIQCGRPAFKTQQNYHPPFIGTAEVWLKFEKKNRCKRRKRGDRL